MNDITRIQTLFRRHEYYRQMRMRLFSTFIKLALKRAVARTSTDREDIVGYKVDHLNLKVLCQLFDEIFICAPYYFRAAGATPFIIDCGSNIGMSILFFKHLYPDAEIIGFEPEQEIFAKLEENIRYNRLKNVSVHNKAVSDKDGTITLFSDPSVSGSLMTSVMDSRATGKGQDAEAVRLSSYITREVDLLKLDIEGAEQPVLEELGRSGKIAAVKEMIIEYHHHMDRGCNDFSRFLSILEVNGFGYQITSSCWGPFVRETFQDLLVYAYRK